MSSTQIFISYSKENRVLVNTLADDLRSLGYSPWYDQQLSGGQLWWLTILKAIEKSKIFVAVLSSDSLASRPCLLELEYALDCQRNVLPLIIDRNFNRQPLPAALQRNQYIYYDIQDKVQSLALSKALNEMPPTKRLPRSRPLGPETPIEPFNGLRDKMDNLRADWADQQSFLDTLELHLQNPLENRDAYALLQRLLKPQFDAILIHKTYNRIIDLTEHYQAPFR